MRLSCWNNQKPPYQLAEKYPGVSSYTYCMNNPVNLVDPDGRRIDVSYLTRTKGRTSVERKLYKAFILSAKTSEGHSFLKQYAQKGQKILYGGKVIFEAKEDGKYHTAGIDLVYKKAPVYYDDGTVNTSSDTSANPASKNHRAKVLIRISPNPYGIKYGEEYNTFNAVEHITHESLLHANSTADDYLDDGSWNYSNLPKNYRQYRVHADHYYVSDSYLEGKSVLGEFPTKGLSILKQVNKELGTGFSDIQIKTKMWYFSGSLIKINQKTGNPTKK